MSRRRTVCDYAGNELYPGDLINYPTRQGNRVRATDAIILAVKTKRLSGRVVPFLEVRPTGFDSGFVPRRSLRREEIGTEHVRLVTPNATGEQG